MTLNYKTLGSGKPLVILHGLLGSLDNWLTVSKYLSKSYKVYIIDLPNHGKSYHSQVFSYEDMSNDLDSFFNKNGLTNFSLLGHSMGGKLALKYTDMFVDNSDVDIQQGDGRMFLWRSGVNLQEIVNAINSIGASPDDLMAILQALKEAGAINAEIIVI